MSFKPNNQSGQKSGYQRPAVAGNTAVAASNTQQSNSKSGSSVQPAAVLKYSEATPEGAEQSKMVRITGLFNSKSGNGYTATLKEAVTIPAGARLFLFINDSENTAK
jgi:hypothetical protein